MEEVMDRLKDENSIFLVGCKGCAESCQTGGEVAVKKDEGCLIFRRQEDNRLFAY